MEGWEAEEASRPESFSFLVHAGAALCFAFRELKSFISLLYLTNSDEVSQTDTVEDDGWK